MEQLTENIVPYLISQIVSIILLFVAWKWTKVARILFALLFFWASGTNLYLGLVNPKVYLEYGEFAIPLYSNLINGWFGSYFDMVIPLIAIGQFFVALGMLLKGWLVKIACIGVILFLLAIAPLMVASAFPFSITVSIAAFLIYRKNDFKYIWKNNQAPENLAV
jgi:hypothetical protein